MQLAFVRIHQGRFRIVAALILSVCTACGPLDPIVRHQVDGKLEPGPLDVRLGYHYKPPGDGTDASIIADAAAFVILTKKDEPFREKLRAAGYTGLVLQYIRGSEVEGPPTTDASSPCDTTYVPFANHVADQVGDFCTYIHPHEDWFLHNARGERLYDGQRRYYHMNPASAGWRAFVLERLQRSYQGDAVAPALGYDGFFLDNIELSRFKKLKQLNNSDGTLQEFADDQSYRAAWQGWLSYLRAGLGGDVPIWGNLIAGKLDADNWTSYLPFLDGVMHEAFATGYRPLKPEEYETNLRQAERVLAAGKGFYAVSQGDRDDTQLQQFAFASYLLIAQAQTPSYFRYSLSGQHYDEWWAYDNYEVELGEARGLRYHTSEGWRRDFANGYVLVDPQTRTGTIVITPPSAVPATASES